MDARRREGIGESHEADLLKLNAAKWRRFSALPQPKRASFRGDYLQEQIRQKPIPVPPPPPHPDKSFK
jgi:hypothetical protein